MAAKIDNNQLVLRTSSITPVTPASGNALLYADSSDNYRQIDDTGTDRSLISTIGVTDVNSSVSVNATGIIFPQNGVKNPDNYPVIYPYPIPTRRMWVSADAKTLSSGTTVYATGGVLKIAASSVAYTSNSGDNASTKFGTSTTTNIPNGIDNSSPTSTIDPVNIWMTTTCKGLFYVKIKTDASSISDQAIFAGFVSSTISADDIGTTQGVYFRYSTSASDTQWQIIVHASSANRTVLNTGVTVQANTTYELLFYMYSDSVRFYINGNVITKIPYPSGFGGVAACSQVTVQTKTASSKYLDVYKIYYESIA